jgi:hypothetical protein
MGKVLKWVGIVLFSVLETGILASNPPNTLPGEMPWDRLGGFSQDYGLIERVSYG